jgi:hypothetical protein
MLSEDVKLQLLGCFEDVASNCNSDYVSKAQCRKEAYNGEGLEDAD